MRVDVATILVGMGFQSVVDFIATQTTPTNVDVLWLSTQPQPTDAEIDAYALAHPTAYQDRLTLDARTAASTAVDTDRSPLAKTHRAIASVLVDELNILRQWDMSLKAAVAAATTLADLKTRVAALPNLADRTLTQAKQAIQAAINAGTVD